MPTDGRCKKTSQCKDTTTKRGSVPAAYTARSFYGATYLFDKIGSKLGITEEGKNSFFRLQGRRRIDKEFIKSTRRMYLHLYYNIVKILCAKIVRYILYVVVDVGDTADSIMKKKTIVHIRISYMHRWID